MVSNNSIKLNPSWEVALSKEYNWIEFVEYIRRIPYGRSSVRGDLALVISENKGTCSSKHALLKQVADENNIPDVKLILGIYKMNKLNTPGIGTTLDKSKLEYIPEAHCYLMIKDQRVDYTNVNSNIQKVEKDLLSELEIEPDQITDFKVKYHQKFLSDWLEKEGHTISFTQLWKLRELCIQKLSN